MKHLFTIIVSLVAVTLVGCSDSYAGPRDTPNGEQIVLAHGLGRSDTAMWRLTQRLENSGYEVCVLDYDTIGESIQSVVDSTESQIDACLHSPAKTHFIGHSLGGLVIRSYLQNHAAFSQSEQMGEVVLVGTPNKGSELADHYDGRWLMELGGEVSQSLVTGENSLGNQLQELDINIGIIAGTKSMLLTDDIFDGPNDGLVSVESTKLSNMSDFVEIEVGHSAMRYNEEVANQAIHFLRHSSFNNTDF